MSVPTADLVLVHGWASRPSVWSGVAPDLERRFRLTVATLPGYGGDAGIPRSATDLAQWLQSRTPAGAVWLVWSTAALPAVLLAGGPRPHIASLNVVAGVVRFTRAQGWPAGSAPSVVDEFRAALRDDPRALLHRFARLVFPGREGRQVAARFVAEFLEGGVPVDALDAGLVMLGESDVRWSLPRIEVPVTLFHGGRDRVVAPASSTASAAMLADGRVCVMPESGHAPFYSDPDGFLRQFYDEGRY